MVGFVQLGARVIAVLAVAATLRGQAWSLDPAVAPAVINETSFLLSSRFTPAGGSQFFVSGDFTHVNGAAARGLARIGADGRIAPAFAADLAADDRVQDVAPLPDGRSVALIGARAIIATSVEPAVSGTPVRPDPTTNVDPTGVSAPTIGVVVPVSSTVKLIRLRADGRKDTDFSPLAIAGSARLTALPDGRVAVSGNFSAIGGTARNGLARLNADGTLDGSFAPALTSAALNVTTVAPAPDGGLVVSAAAFPRNAPATFLFTRLSADGSVDAHFAPGQVRTTFPLLAVQPDGSVLAGGGIALLYGEIPSVLVRSGTLTRYSPTGEIDRGFAVQLAGGIQRLLPLPGGRFAVEASVAANRTSLGAPGVFVFSPNGQLERDLRAVSGAREGQRLLAVLPDGRMLVAQGTLVLSSSYPYVLTPDDPLAPPERTATAIAPVFIGPVLVDAALALSTADAAALTPLATTVTHRAAGTAHRLEPDAAGRVLVHGTFTHIDGQPRAGLARFLAGGALDPTFSRASGTLLFAPPDGRPIARQTTIGPRGNDGFRRYVTSIVRLQADGGVDPAFALPSALETAQLNWLLAAPDGRLLVSAFEPNGSREENLKLIWLAADGRRLATLPTVFGGFTRQLIYPAQFAEPIPVGGVVEPATGVITVPTSPTGGPAEPPVLITPIVPPIYARPNPIDAVQLLAGDRLLVAGAFSRVNGAARRALVRLRSDGAVDAEYAADTSPLRYINFALPFPDGRALVFGSWIGTGRWQPRAIRLRVDGSVDPAFQPPDGLPAYGIQRLADGSLWANGRRYSADGWPDLNFAPQLQIGRFPGFGQAAAMTADGRLWLGGSFDRVDGQPRTALVRFTPTEIAGITVSPLSQTVVAGRNASFQVATGTAQPATYRWTHQGAALAGATTALLQLTRVRPDQAGVYRAIVTIGSQTFTSDPATLTVLPNGSRLVNFSARSVVSPADPPQIAGFVTASGVAPRRVLLRAVGRGIPGSLGAPMLPVPVLTLYEDRQPLAEDRGGALAAAVTAVARAVGAFPLSTTPTPPGAIYGSALMPAIAGGAFTAATSSGDAGTGVSLFEFYDTGSEAMPPLVRNLSIRGRTGPGAAVLTAGFVVRGNGPLRLLLRGLGPALAAFGVGGTITDPQLQLYAAGMAEAFATDEAGGGAPGIAAAAGAFPLDPGSRDAALLLTLESGAYTTQLSSAGGAAGTAMIEIYVVDD